MAREGLLSAKPLLGTKVWGGEGGNSVHSHSFPGQISRDLVFQPISWKMPHNEDIPCYVLYLCFHLILTEIITSISG